MLVIERRQGEGIQIGGEVEIEVVEINGAQVKLGLTAPAEINIRRRDAPRFRAAPAQRPDRDSA